MTSLSAEFTAHERRQAGQVARLLEGAFSWRHSEHGCDYWEQVLGRLLAIESGADGGKDPRGLEHLHGFIGSENQAEIDDYDRTCLNVRY